MGCTLGIRIIHLQEDLQPKTATESRSKSRDRIHDGGDVLKRLSPDITSHTNDGRTAESPLKTQAPFGHAMSGAAPPSEGHQEDNEMLPSICKVQDKKPPCFQGSRGVNFPSIAFPCSPRKPRTLPLSVKGPEGESIRMRALRGLIQKQLSDVTDGRRSRLPPICPSKLRKSSSCNDSWLQEIRESDEVLPEIRLPAITEVDPAGMESKLLSSTRDFLAVPGSRTVSMRSLQTRNSWLTSCSNAKRVAIPSRDRSPMASMENPRLPVILEDLDCSSPSGSSPKRLSSKSLDNAPDTLESRSLLQVPKMAIPAENSVWLSTLGWEGEFPRTQEVTPLSPSHGYSQTMAEILGISDSCCAMDSDILDNMTFDPSSPLLVTFVSKDSNSNSAEHHMEVQNRSNDQACAAAEAPEDEANGNVMSDIAGHGPSADTTIADL